MQQPLCCGGLRNDTQVVPCGRAAPKRWGYSVPCGCYNLISQKQNPLRHIAHKNLNTTVTVKDNGNVLLNTEVQKPVFQQQLLMKTETVF